MVSSLLLNNICLDLHHTTLILTETMMNKQGFIHFILIAIFIIFPVVHSMVEIELSVLQFDNPLGTSYTGQNLNGARKCCDAGGSNCRNTSDTCDVYFTFCIGSLSHSSVDPGCNGTSVDMSQDVSLDVFKIINTRPLRTVTTHNSSWLEGYTQLIVNVLDLDELPGSANNPHVFPDLIDAFNKVIDFEPAQNFWSSQQHDISLVGHVSMNVGIRAWCARGWYGHSCERQCTADAFYSCSLDGTQLPYRECTDTNILVLSLNTTISHLVDKTSLKRNITRFLADNICLNTTNRINITIHEIREHKDGYIDVVFNAFCDNTAVSDLKFRATMDVFDQITTRLDPHESYFKSQVISPRIQYVKEALAEYSIVYLIRFVHYENKISCLSEARTICNPRFTVSFSDSKIVTSAVLINTTNLTDCNSVYIDLGKTQSRTSSTNSTILFLLTNYQHSVFIDVGDVGDATSNITSEKHTFSLPNQLVGWNFRESFPKILPTSKNYSTWLTIEVMAWCNNCRQRDQCQVDIAQCKHGGRCVNQKCQCLQGWTGPFCNTDIDECALGVCEHIESCSNTPGGYTCTCSNGFSGKTCEVDIDECTADPCKPGLECLNTFGSYVCIGVCRDNTVHPNCTGIINFCSEEPCENNGTCLNNANNYTCSCAEGWSGYNCQTNIDECTNSSLCQNGGNCTDTSGSFSCQCPSTFTGSYCDVDVNECLDSDSCSNNGTCANTFGGYTCACLPGYTGTSCTNDVNECLLNYCQHGQCRIFDGGYTCLCEDGWEGQNCSVDRDECSTVNPCSNGGTCINNPGSNMCKCTEYWRGKHCLYDVDECLATNACNYNGNCTNTNGSFTCSCYSGWTGVTCADDINECLSSPCQNSGTCNNTKGEYSCICPRNWEGKNCDNDINECVNSPCEHGGTCINFQGSYNCKCTLSWTGNNCTDDIDECLLTNACINGGSCVNTAGSYLCNCLSHWTGPKCDTDINKCQGQPCLNGGTCLNVANGYSCSCTPAWTGQNCSGNVDECVFHAGICVHGLCNDTEGSYTCDCFQGYEGKNCDKDIDECRVTGICQNEGTCKNMNGSYVCRCLKGWQGINCTDDINECLSQNPCNHSGVCENVNGGFTCLCQQGWTGKTCETDIDECVKTPCLHGGTCVNNGGSFTCNCASGWEGNTCQNNTDDCIAITCKNGGTCQDLINEFMCACPNGYTGKLCDIDDCASRPCNNGGICHNHTIYYECACPEGWNGTRCSEDVDECLKHPCGGEEACQNTAGSYTCVKEYFTTVSTSTTTAPSTKPFVVDVFSLEFVGPVSDDIKPRIKDGIVGILKLLMCHDSTIIEVSLVQNSITLPNTVEFHAQCDGHHLTNEEVNDAIRTLSDDKLMQYFPIGLKNPHAPPEKQNWLLTHIPVVAGGAGGLLVLIIIIITVVCVKKMKAGVEENVQFSKDIVEPINDVDGQATITIRNPVYDSIYPHQTQI